MRLIDAEKCPCIVCEDTRNAHCTYEHRSCEKFCNWLNNNAFDTEKVVEQLSCNSRFIDDINEHNIKCISCVIGQKTAIDIVKKGGVE